MAKLLQTMEMTKQKPKLLKPETELLTKHNELFALYAKSVDYLGDTAEFKEKINALVLKELTEIRMSHWSSNKKLPKDFLGKKTLSGTEYDHYTALSMYPKVGINQYRALADKLNLVIIPLAYTEILKLFATQSNNEELKTALAHFTNNLSKDEVFKYDMYMLCPINYYSVWEQIKSDTILDIYYPEYFENVFTTIELMIPTQKNLYLISNSNREDLSNINAAFKQNIDMLSSKIQTISGRVDKLEKDFLTLQMEQVEIKRAQEQQKREAEEARQEAAILSSLTAYDYSYEDMDPILFAVPKGTNIKTDNVDSIVGLCWGADISDVVLDLKGIKIHCSDMADIDPINIQNKIDLLNTTFDLSSVVRANKYLDIDRNIKHVKNGAFTVSFKFKVTPGNYYPYYAINLINVYDGETLVASAKLDMFKSVSNVDLGEAYLQMAKGENKAKLEALNLKVNKYIDKQKLKIVNH